jgi:hypothetical protein
MNDAMRDRVRGALNGLAVVTAVKFKSPGTFAP